MLRGPVARAGSCRNASTLPLLQPCLLPSYTCVLLPLSLARSATLVHAVSLAGAQLAAGLAFLPMSCFCSYCCSSWCIFFLFLFSFLLFLQISWTPMPLCLLMYAQPAHMPILFFHLYFHFSNTLTNM